ncbi:MAG: hypothetical protein AAFY39_00185, partial [Pseudomonadota bacterium]
IALADWLEPALALGRAYALAWDAAKARDGLIDFDDQIRRPGRSQRQGVKFEVLRTFQQDSCGFQRSSPFCWPSLPSRKKTQGDHLLLSVILVGHF